MYRIYEYSSRYGDKTCIYMGTNLLSPSRSQHTNLYVYLSINKYKYMYRIYEYSSRYGDKTCIYMGTNLLSPSRSQHTNLYVYLSINKCTYMDI
jgi:hypothetical protein